MTDMIPLTDKQWSQFNANYSDGGTVAVLLQKAYSGVPMDRWYDDIFQELCHQYTVSEAAYPAAPHLVYLARKNTQIRKHLLVLFGTCYAYTEKTNEKNLSAEILSTWKRSAKEAIPLLLKELAEPQPGASDFLYLVASLAVFSGYPTLARHMENLDYEDE
jgi:hypothetical protein